MKVVDWLWGWGSELFVRSYFSDRVDWVIHSDGKMEKGKACDLMMGCYSGMLCLY